jgi:hypothetical protein
MAKAKTARITKTNPSEITLVPEIRKNSNGGAIEEDIRRRAYQLYEERGCVPGHDHEDWLSAEREVLARSNHRPSA